MRHPARTHSSDRPRSWKQPFCLAGIQVLLVEDELDVAELLRLILNEAGAQVSWVTQASEALVHLEQAQPDLLICNVRLPDQDGEWLIQQIRRREATLNHHLPAIAISSYIRDISSQKMLDAGFERYLPKTFETKELIATILELL